MPAMLKLAAHLLWLVLFAYHAVAAEETWVPGSVNTKASEASDQPTPPTTAQVHSPREERMMGLSNGIQEKLAGSGLWKKLTESRFWKELARIPSSVKRKVASLRLVQTIASSWLVKTLAPSIYLRFAANKQAAVDDLFTRYKVGAEVTKPLESAAFKKWLHVVEKSYKRNEVAGAVMISTLVKHYSDNAKLTNMLTQAYETPVTHTTAEFLILSLVDKWRREKKEISDTYLYTLLRLDAEDVDVLKSPSLRTWLLLCEMSGKDTVQRHEFLLQKLLEHHDYKTLDEMLATTIAEGGKPAAVAGMLRLASWRKRGATPEEVYKMSKEANAGKANDLLGGDKADDVVKLSAKKDDDVVIGPPDKADDVVNGPLDNADEVAKLPTDKIDEVVDLPVKKADNVVELPADKIDDVVDLPALRNFISLKYLEPADGTDLIESLLKSVKEEDLARAIVPPTIEDGLSDTLDYVSELLIYHWIGNGRTAEEVFNRIKLNADADNLFENPVLSLWVAFVKSQDEKGAAKTMYEVVNKFYGDAEKFKKMVARAEKSSSETAREMGAILKSQL